MKWILLPMTLLLTGCVIIMNNPPTWKTIAKRRLSEYGQGNWIVVADAAYPKQSGGGIETVYTGTDAAEVLRHVLKTIDETGHLRPVIMVDTEPGSAEWKTLLGNREVQVMPHGEIMAKLDEGGRRYSILVLKTDEAGPQSSFFIELDGGGPAE